MARRHAYDFARFVAPDAYVWNWHHGLLYRKLDGFAKGTIKRLIVEMPPGHGKSEGCSRNLPAFLFGRWPDCRVIACSYTQDLAAEMNRDVQRVMDGTAYAEVFPGVRLGSTNIRALAGKPRRNSDVFDIPGHRGYYKAAGVGVGIGGRRFDRGIIDDPIKDREEANSPTHRERVWRWFTSTFYTRQAKDACICITSTRWHEDDLVGRIKRKVAAGETEEWDVLTLPALATDSRHADDPRQPGEALWPWFRPAAELERLKTLEPRDFFSLQQQDPRGEGGTEWGPEYFGPGIWFDDWPHPDQITLITIGLDPSKGKADGDYSAFVVIVRSKDGTLWIEADLARRPAQRIVEDGLALARRIREETGKPVDGLGCESDAFQELLANEFVRLMKERGFTLPVFKMTTENKSKVNVRILRLSSDITHGLVRYRRTPGTRLLVRQLEEFPNGAHDDGPDAMEYAKRLAVSLWNKGRRR